MQIGLVRILEYGLFSNRTANELDCVLDLPAGVEALMLYLLQCDVDDQHLVLSTQGLDM